MDYDDNKVAIELTLQQRLSMTDEEWLQWLRENGDEPFWEADWDYLMGDL